MEKFEGREPGHPLPTDPRDILIAMQNSAPRHAERTLSPADMPNGQIEQDVASIWSELLGITPVGRNEDFFALGGHSLMAMDILSRIRSRLHVELPLAALFSETGFTVAELAKKIENALLEQASAEDIAAILADMERDSVAAQDGSINALSDPR